MSRSSYVLAVVCLLAADGHAESGPPVRIEAFTLKTFDGQEHQAEVGRLAVMENRRSGSARRIDVAFVRLPHRGPERGTPIVFLPPGPGILATTLGRVPPYFRLFDRLRDEGDVILLDLRGEGLSSPNLDDCPAPTTVSPHALESYDALVRQIAASVANCANYWRGKGVDLSAYEDREIVEDVHELQAALGYGKIALLGFSAGTDLGVEVLRRHGDEVARAVFAATGAAELRPNLPSTYDRQLRKTAYWYQATVPERTDLVALLAADIKALEERPPTLLLKESREGPAVEVRVGGVALESVVAEILNGSVGSLPALLLSVRDRDYSLLQIYVQKMFDGLHSSMTLLGRTIDCSLPMPPSRRSRVEDEARSSPFGNIRNVHLERAVCAAAAGRTEEAEGREALFSTVPTLFVSGSLDANTPPFNAEELLWGFPNGRHLVVVNAFHETLVAPAVQQLVVDFFGGKAPDASLIRFEPPRFLSLEEARAAALRSR
jgi:pimeloyl-ACP methyl ester carboxylesterase